jgi:hypothetical protein
MTRWICTVLKLLERGPWPTNILYELTFRTLENLLLIKSLEKDIRVLIAQKDCALSSRRHYVSMDCSRLSLFF